MIRPKPIPASSEQHDALYTVGSKQIWPHLQFADRVPNVISAEAKADLRGGISKLKDALEIRPGNIKNWSTFWLLGKAYEALGEFENSYRYFKCAFEINPEQVDIARELMASSLRTARFNEAVRAAKVARELSPSNPGIVANLSLVFLRNGQLDEALTACREALDLAPSDTITQSLFDSIELARRARK